MAPGHAAADGLGPTAPAEFGWAGARDEFVIFVANVRDYAILRLDPAGHVSSWDTGARRIKGYEAEEIPGCHFRVFYSREDRAQGLPERHLVAAAERGEMRYEGWRLRRDGSRFWADVVLTAVFDEAGRLPGFGKVTRDVTERREAEQTLTHRTLHDVERAAQPGVASGSDRGAAGRRRPASQHGCRLRRRPRPVQGGQRQFRSHRGRSGPRGRGEAPSARRPAGGHRGPAQSTRAWTRRASAWRCSWPASAAPWIEGRTRRSSKPPSRWRRRSGVRRGRRR